MNKAKKTVVLISTLIAIFYTLVACSKNESEKNRNGITSDHNTVTVVGGIALENEFEVSVKGNYVYLGEDRIAELSLSDQIESEGLEPYTYEVVSGPAMLLEGSVLRATQPGVVTIKVTDERKKQAHIQFNFFDQMKVFTTDKDKKVFRELEEYSSIGPNESLQLKILGGKPPFRYEVMPDSDLTLDPAETLDKVVYSKIDSNGILRGSDRLNEHFRLLVKDSHSTEKLFNFRVLQQPGAIDQSFGENGLLNLSPSKIIRSSILSRDQKFLFVASRNQTSFVVAKFSAETGEHIDEFGSQDLSSDLRFKDLHGSPRMLEQSDGKILVVIEDFKEEDHVYERLALRFTAEGQFDSTFGANGKLIFGRTRAHFSISQEFVVEMDSKGRLYFVGTSLIPTSSKKKHKMTLARYQKDGAFDDSFGDKGEAVLSGNFRLGQGNSLEFIKNGTSGQAVLSGHIQVDSGWRAALMFLSDSGVADTNYGKNGILDIDPDHKPCCLQIYQAYLNDASSVLVTDDTTLLVGAQVAGTISLIKLEKTASSSTGSKPERYEVISTRIYHEHQSGDPGTPRTFVENMKMIDENHVSMRLRPDYLSQPNVNVAVDKLNHRYSFEHDEIPFYNRLKETLGNRDTSGTGEVVGVHKTLDGKLLIVRPMHMVRVWPLMGEDENH